MVLDQEFYNTERGRRLAAVIRETSERLIAREYNLIPCDNMREPLESRWKDAMDEMLDHYFVKLLPWEPGRSRTWLLYEDERSFFVEAFFRHDNDGVVEDAAIVMKFNFYKDGKTEFEGIQY